ncbi:MAG: hypothetical protein WBF53_10740 [Litorimonas sp.]
MDRPKAVALAPASPIVPPAPALAPDTEVPLSRLAWLRSGDKGDTANIGVAARHPDHLPYIWAALTEDAVRDAFDHFVRGEVMRWYLPGTHAINVLMDRALGGGGMASLRNDPQGKSYAQVLASFPIPVTRSMLNRDARKEDDI